MTSLSQILSDVYGVGALVAPACSVLWACERIADKETAVKELKKLNRQRHKAGKPLVYAPFGHHAF